jgi:hypothetical protein
MLGTAERYTCVRFFTSVFFQSLENPPGPLHFLVDIGPLYCSMVKKKKIGPFKGARYDYICLRWLSLSSAQWVHMERDSLSTTSTTNETLTSTESAWVRLYINWVNAEWASISEYFIILHWLSWHGVPFPRWLSRCEVSLGVGSVDVEWDSRVTLG